MKRKNREILKKFEENLKSRSPKERSLYKNLEILTSLIEDLIKINGALSVPRLAIALGEIYDNEPYYFAPKLRKLAETYSGFVGIKKTSLKDALISYYGLYDKIETGNFRGTYSTLLYRTKEGLEKYLKEYAPMRTETRKVVKVSEDSL